MVARVLDANIFQPTYLLGPGSGFRELLVEQARDESRKESALRSSIHALLPKRQAASAAARVEQACNEIIQVVQGILPGDSLPEFQERLEEIVHEACNRWGHVVRSESAIEPSFSREDYSDWAWHELRFDAGKTTVTVRTRESNEDAEGDLLVVFPRCYTWDRDGDNPVSHGVVLSSSQVMAARQEDAERQSKSRTLSTKRTRTRRVSNDGVGRQQDIRARGFLS